MTFSSAILEEKVIDDISKKAVQTGQTKVALDLYVERMIEKHSDAHTNKLRAFMKMCTPEQRANFFTELLEDCLREAKKNDNMERRHFETMTGLNFVLVALLPTYQLDLRAAFENFKATLEDAEIKTLYQLVIEPTELNATIVSLPQLFDEAQLRNIRCELTELKEKKEFNVKLFIEKMLAGANPHKIRDNNGDIKNILQIAVDLRLSRDKLAMIIGALKVDDLTQMLQGSHAKALLQHALYKGKGNPRMFITLATAGVDPKLAVHMAAEIGTGAYIDALAESKIDINALNDEGQTPLCVAASLKNYSVVMSLISNGANLNIEDPTSHKTFIETLAEFKSDEFDTVVESLTAEQFYNDPVAPAKKSLVMHMLEAYLDTPHKESLAANSLKRALTKVAELDPSKFYKMMKLQQKALAEQIKIERSFKPDLLRKQVELDKLYLSVCATSEKAKITKPVRYLGLFKHPIEEAINKHIETNETKLKDLEAGKKTKSKSPPTIK